MNELAETLPATTVPSFVRRSSDAEVRRFNTLVGTHRAFAFAWSGKPALLRFVDVSHAPRVSGWLRVRLGDHSFDLGLPALPEPSSLGAAFAGIEIAALPEELLLGVLEAWLEEPLAALQRQSLALHLEAWQTAESPPAASCDWEIAWDGRERFLAGTLHADTETLSFLAGLVHRAAPSPASSADAIPFPVSIAIARLSLPLATVQTLAAGDVLLLPITANEHAQGHCELWTGERRLGRALRQQHTVKILTMNSSSETKPAIDAATPLRVDELPVQVVFDVGQLDLSVGQLRTLGEGYTFELPAVPERLVTIRANGREIGQGELVEIGEKVGVRIVNWSLA
jgi:type III secretion system YscQ/HrcQ family protein